MTAHNISTDRLFIIPMSYAIVHSVLKGENKELDKLGIKTNGKWPLADTIDILNFIKDDMEKSDEPSGFDVWMVVKKGDMTVIGDAGFRGKPDENGEIEIGFGLIKEEQRKGYGYELASGLLSWAFSQKGVKTIKADCLKDNNASINLLQKCGMNEINRDEEMIYWEIKSK